MNNEKQTCKACGGEGKFVADTMTSFGTGEREETRCNACCGFGVLYVERATTASAAPTIDTPEFRDLLGTLIGAYGFEDDKPYIECRRKLLAMIDQHASARAEETRREAVRERDAARANVEAFHQAACNAAAEVAELRKQLAAAQRTADGDAVPLLWLSSQQVDGLVHIAGSYLPFQREPGGNFDFPVFDRRPVAEAAAQADDAGGRKYFAALEKLRVSNGYGPSPAAPTAQPTPPDDELRQALSALLKRYGDLAGSGDAGNWDWEAEEVVVAARAALRQPGALPDEALEQAAKLCDEIHDDWRARYKGRAPHAPNNPHRADPHADGVSDGASQCADAIRALAAKQAGKEA